MSKTINSLTSADDLVPVTKSDTVNDPAGPFRGILLDAEGVLRVTMASGATRNFIAAELAPGIIHPINILRVHSTGTGSQGIKGAV